MFSIFGAIACCVSAALLRISYAYSTSVSYVCSSFEYFSYSTVHLPRKLCLPHPCPFLQLPPTRSINDSEDDKNFELHKNILQWNPTWLDDPKYDKFLPSIFDIGKILKPALLFYESWKDYIDTIQPLMLLELFHQLKKPNEDVEIGKKVKNQSFVTEIHKCSECKYFKGYTLMVKSSKLKRGTYPTCGDLVRLKSNYELFGYVKHVLLNYKNEKHVFFVLTNLSQVNFPSDKTVKLTTMPSARQHFRQLEAIESLRLSPLLNLILIPRANEYRMSDALIPSINHKLNNSQLNVIAKVTRTVQLRETKICLIQGPPGTGKSTVIVEAICEILKQPGTKVLICTPSNKAVDEIVLKLLNVQVDKKNQGISLKIVRIGIDESMDPDVKKVSLTNLSSGKEEVSQISDKKAAYFQHKREENILINANIIASTLASSASRKMLSLYGPNGGYSISACIVDEAGQGTEPSTLIPLMLRINRLILFGDHQQLSPTVISPHAKNYGLDMFLFSRAQKNFYYELLSPIVMLDTQYRMVEEIARWPNKYFYSNKLKSRAKDFPFPFCQYKVINHNSKQTGSQHANIGEANLVLKILLGIIQELIEREGEIPSIGVITPYQHQKKVITELLNDARCRMKKSHTLDGFNNQKGVKKEIKNSRSRYRGKEKIGISYLSENMSSQKDVKAAFINEKNQFGKTNEEVLEVIMKVLNSSVNTVDSFQGQEKDIIIMSCVRSHGIGFVSDPNRLNVSLTRAKHTMIILGNFEAFSNNSMWKSLLTDAKNRGYTTTVNDIDSTPETMRHLILKKKQMTDELFSCFTERFNLSRE